MTTKPMNLSVNTPDDVVEAATSELRKIIRDAQVELVAQVRAACVAGDQHNPIQHRDGRSPWCNSCRRYADGRKVLESDGRLKRQ